MSQVDTALSCAQFLAGGGGVFVASDTSAGMSAASRILGEGGFLSYATVEPGRSGGDALLDGYAFAYRTPSSLHFPLVSFPKCDFSRAFLHPTWCYECLHAKPSKRMMNRGNGEPAGG
jgi:hypothetical protein